MRKFGLWLICLLVLASIKVSAEIYPLVDGTKIDGDPISVNDTGVVFRTADGTDQPRIIWDKFTQEAIQKLYATVKKPAEKAMIEPLIEEAPQEKAQRKEFTVKPIEPPIRPKTGLGVFAIFSSPVGLMILIILYVTNLFAAYEVALYRRQPLGMVCGLAAIPFLGILSPIIFISMPASRGPAQMEADEAQTRFHATPPPSEAVSAPPADVVAETVPEAAPVVTALATPAPVVFRRADFSFNRRFFETRLAGFFRVVPSEAEKDLVLYVKAARGEFVGRRISNITASELSLQVFHNEATADEVIPFLEIMEVQIRHKDAV